MSPVDRAAHRAATFAATARTVQDADVVESVEDTRPFPWSPLTRTYRVDVTDHLGRVTSGSWSVALEVVESRRRAVRFFGWGFSPYSPGRRISESLARIRVSV